MNITTAIRTYGSVTRHNVRANASAIAEATRDTVRTQAAATKTTAQAVATKETAQRGAAFGLSVAKSFAAGVAVNMVVFETLDAVVAFYQERTRRRNIDELAAEIVKHGLSEDREKLMEQLKRVPPRRTFAEFIRDLPSRTFRRLWRAVKFEAGWWLAVFTAPVWAPATLLGWLWKWLVVYPVHTVREIFTGRQDLEFIDRWNAPSRWAAWIRRYSLNLGVRTMINAAEMTVYNKTSIYCHPEGEEFLDELQPKVFAEVADIKDNLGAFNWGSTMAEMINRDARDPLAKQRAYAQFKTWVEPKFAPQFLHAVLGGFRHTTPLVYRDYAMA